MERDYFEEYLVSIKPDVDPGLWNKATGNIRSTIQKAIFSPLTKELDKARAQLKSLTEQKTKILATLKSGKDESGKELTAEQKEALETESKQLGEAIKGISGSIKVGEDKLKGLSEHFSKAGVIMTAYIAVVKSAIETAKKVIKESEKISNQFVSQSSIKVDTGVRDIMGKFGVDTQTALGISTAAETLGYDLNEYSKWTNAQREAFSELMQTYQSGIDAIDPQKLEDFNKATQEYQLMVAKFQVKMKVALTDLFASSEAVQGIMETFAKTLDSIANILSSDAVKEAFDLIMGIIDGILKFVTAPLNWLGGGSSSSVTNNNRSVTVNNNISSTGGINSEQLAVDIGLSVRNAMS